MIIIHVSVQLGLLLIIIFSHVQYTSIIIMIGFLSVIFHDGALIVVGSNTINENLIPPLHCRRATPSHNLAMVVASLLWITFVNKIIGGHSWSPMLIRYVMVCYRDDIASSLSWTLGRIGVTRHNPFTYIIIF